MVWRTWLFIAYSNARFNTANSHYSTSLIQSWENVLFYLGSEKVTNETTRSTAKAALLTIKIINRTPGRRSLGTSDTEYTIRRLECSFMPSCLIYITKIAKKFLKSKTHLSIKIWKRGVKRVYPRSAQLRFYTVCNHDTVHTQNYRTFTQSLWLLRVIPGLGLTEGGTRLQEQNIEFWMCLGTSKHTFFEPQKKTNKQTKTKQTRWIRGRSQAKDHSRPIERTVLLQRTSYSICVK